MWLYRTLETCCILPYDAGVDVHVSLVLAQLHRIVRRSVEFADVVRSLQTERDMTVMYLCAGYPQMQMIESYLESSEAITQLSSWPVNPSRDLGVQFSTLVLTHSSAIVYME